MTVPEYDKQIELVRVVRSCKHVIVRQRHIDVTLPEWLTGSPAKVI